MPGNKVTEFICTVYSCEVKYAQKAADEHLCQAGSSFNTFNTYLHVGIRTRHAEYSTVVTYITCIHMYVIVNKTTSRGVLGLEGSWHEMLLTKTGGARLQPD